MDEAEDKRSSRLNGLDTWLGVFEAVIALSISAAVLLVVAYEIWWNLLATSVLPRQERIRETLATLNDNWKAAAIVLVPLFYRTIRTFLEKLRKGPFGMEKEQEPEQESTKKNPTQAHDEGMEQRH